MRRAVLGLLAGLTLTIFAAGDAYAPPREHAPIPGGLLRDGASPTRAETTAADAPPPEAETAPSTPDHRPEAKAPRISPIVDAPKTLEQLEAPPPAEPEASAEEAEPATAGKEVADTALSPELARELADLVAALEDETARSRIIARLQLLMQAREEVAAEEAEPPRSVGRRITDAVALQLREIGERSSEVISYLKQVPGLGTWFARQATEPDKRAAWALMFWQFLAMFAGGFAADLVTRGALRRLHDRLVPRHDDPGFERSLILAGLGLVEFMPIAAFTVGAYLVLVVLDPEQTTHWAAVGLITAVLFARTVQLLSRMLLRPALTELRVVPLPDAAARDLHAQIVVVTALLIYGFYATEMGRYLGLPASLLALTRIVLGVAVVAFSVRLILALGRKLRDWLRALIVPADGNGRWQRLREMLADFWQVPVILYVVVVYAIWALGVEGGFDYLVRGTLVTVVVVAVAVLLRALARHLAAVSVRLNDHWRERYPTLERRVDFYIRWAFRLLILAIYAVAGLLILEAWGIDSLGWLASPSGLQALSGVVSVGVVVLIALLVWEIIGFAIEGYLNRRGPDGVPVMPSIRARTLLPVLRNAILIALGLLVGLTALSEIGVNIGPLLAGVGVLGLAVGFGAQELVKDVINGLFILFENSIAVGDVVDLGGHSGVVEAMTIRTITLRDLSGTVHVVPFSQVTTITNMTKEYAFALIDVGVAYREDTDEVTDVLRALAVEMREDPDWRSRILEDLEVLGVDRLADSAVVVRVRFKTQAGEQWSVNREFNRRMKKRFDELGIEIPFPHQTVYFGADKTGAAVPAHVALEPGAAAEENAPRPAPGPRLATGREGQDD